MANFPPADGANCPSPADKAEALYQNYLAGGPDAAYASLKKDYDASAGMCNRDQYFQQVAADLQSSGHMPNIAVGWLKAEKWRLAEGDGVIYKDDIAKAEAHGGLDAIFGKVVLTSVPSPGDNRTFFDQVAHTKRDYNQSPDGIEDADLRKYSRQEHRAERHEFKHEETEKAAQPLLRNDGELLAALNTDPVAERKGVITGQEMKRFLDDYKRHQGEGVYTADNADYVYKLLHNDVGLVTKHGHHGFTYASLERKTGKSFAELEGDPYDGHLCVPPPVAPTDAHPSTPPATGGAGGDCGVPAKPAEAPEPNGKVYQPTQDPDARIDLQVRKTVDLLSRVQPGQGYDAVAARLLDIHPDQTRTAEDVQHIKTLGREIQKLNGDQSTLHLRTDVVLPVSANIDLLMAEDPNFKAAMDNLKAKMSRPPDYIRPQQTADTKPQPTATTSDIGDESSGCLD